MKKTAAYTHIRAFGKDIHQQATWTTATQSPTGASTVLSTRMTVGSSSLSDSLSSSLSSSLALSQFDWREYS